MSLYQKLMSSTDMMHNQKDEIEQRKNDGDRESKVKLGLSINMSNTTHNSLLVGRKHIKVGEQKLL